MKIPQIGVPDSRTVTSGSPPFSLPVSNPLINIHTNDGLWNDMNRGISEAAGVAKEFGAKLERAQDQSDIADAENKARLSIGNYMTGLQNNSDYKSYTPGLLKLQQNLSSDENLKSLRPEVQTIIKNRYNDLFTGAQIHVNQFARQEQIGQMKTKALSRYDQSINAGDFAGAEQEIRDAVQFQYLAKDEGDKKIADIKPRMAFNQVKNEIQSGDPVAMSAMLDATNEDGSYKHFRDLRDDDRSRLIHAADAQYKHQKEQFALNMQQDLYNGKLTISDVTSAVNKKLISGETGLHLQNQINDPNKVIPWDKNAEKSFRTLQDAEYAWIQSGQTAEDKNKLFDTYTANINLIPKDSRDHFRSTIEKINSPEEKYKESFGYKTSAAIVADALKQNNLYSPVPGYFFGTNNDKSNPTQLANQGRIMEELNTLFRSNPDLQHDVKKASEITNNLVSSIQQGKVIEGFARNYQHVNTFGRNASALKSNTPQPGDIYNGYKLKEGDFLDPNNWEKVK